LFVYAINILKIILKNIPGDYKSMKLAVKYDKKMKIIELEDGTKVLDLLKKLKINLEEVICKRNNKIVTEFEILKDKDNIEIINITTGG